MLNKLKIKDFKCHANTELELKKLNVLVGTNSSGKSSVIQSLLLISHNVSNINSSPLNGHLVSIGDFKEAKNFVTNPDEIIISIEEDEEKLEMKLFSNKNNKDAEIEYKKEKAPSLVEKFNYINNKLHYISAHRIGSQDTYSKNYDNYDRYGILGEYAVDIYEQEKNNPISKKLISDTTSDTLGTQVNYWINKFFGVQIFSEPIAKTDKLVVEFEPTEGRRVRAKNVGSGVSFLKSIIIACLTSKNGDVIIIENPEIHLHPKAQHTLAEFFVHIAKAGIQLIIETHSDHVFNGIRVQLYNKSVTPEDIAVHFFDIESETLLSKHTKVEFSEKGVVKNHVENLFDQFELDINSLLGF